MNSISILTVLQQKEELLNLTAYSMIAVFTIFVIVAIYLVATGKDGLDPKGPGVFESFIDALSEETPASPDPYSGEEWDCSDPALDESPSQTAEPSADQAASCNAAEPSSRHESSSAPTPPAAAFPLFRGKI